MSYHKIMTYLKAHPTPWRYMEAMPEDSLVFEGYVGGMFDGPWKSEDGHGWYQVVVDADDQVVFSANDAEGYHAFFKGDVRALVDFVNLVGEEYEPQHGWDTYTPPTDKRQGTTPPRP